MAHIDSECSVLLTDGSACRRAARYTCGQWHLICASHQSASNTTQPEGCPLCGEAVIMFSHVEDVVPGGRRSTDGFIGSMNSFFLRARDALTFELREEPEGHKSDGDLEEEF